MVKPIPTPSPQTGLRALGAMLREKHPLAALQVFHAEMGDVFRIQLPGFTPVVMVGPHTAHFVLVDARHDLRWRNEDDPVTGLLNHGVLVEDGDTHDYLRRLMNPSLHRQMLEGYQHDMLVATDQVISSWDHGSVRDMLVEMRKIALLILNKTLYSVDYTPEIKRLWSSVLGVIRYISPGVWMVWRGAPRIGYRRYIKRMDEYLFKIIRLRRDQMERAQDFHPDLLSALIANGLEDNLIRDQLLTMLIAGHDTSTALLAWTTYLLGARPEIMRRVQDEIDQVMIGEDSLLNKLNSFKLLNMAIQEALRLYPPIHLGSRIAARDLTYLDYTILAGERVIYSIYLTQRHHAYWENPNEFIPERHITTNRPTPYTWLAFGGGPRNCIGAAFGQLEAKIILSRILSKYDLILVERYVRPHMGATLEPHPGVRVRIERRP